MKKIIAVFTTVLLMVVFASFSKAMSEVDSEINMPRSVVEGIKNTDLDSNVNADLKRNISRAVVENMKNRGLAVNVKIDVLKKMDTPVGYYFMKLTFFDKKAPDVVAGEQYVFSDGNFIVQDFLRVFDMGSTMKDLVFEFSEREVDVSGLSPIIGKVGAKNIVVEITDFQCPYCIEANKYLHSKFTRRDDVVVYMMHMPLRNMHPKAELLAKIFEAGITMGKNFGNELYDPAVHRKTEIELINEYAKKSGDEKRFKELVSSKEIADRILVAESRAKGMGVSSTPNFFINGKMISGFDIPLINKAISEFK